MRAGTHPPASQICDDPGRNWQVQNDSGGPRLFFNSSSKSKSQNHPLEDALAGVPAAKIPDILIVQIRSFPADQDAMATNKGWFYQTYAPVSALMNVRTAGQLVRDRDALKAFDRRWSGKGFRIAHATFQFDGNDAPLSWSMNQSQIHDISREWDKSVNGPDNQDWLQVSCFFHPDSGDCAKLARFGKKGPW